MGNSAGIWGCGWWGNPRREILGGAHWFGIAAKNEKRNLFLVLVKPKRIGWLKKGFICWSPTLFGRVHKSCDKHIYIYIPSKIHLLILPLGPIAETQHTWEIWPDKKIRKTFKNTPLIIWLTIFNFIFTVVNGSGIRLHQFSFKSDWSATIFRFVSFFPSSFLGPRGCGPMGMVNTFG